MKNIDADEHAIRYMEGSTAEKGFIYMPQGMPEDIFEESFFLVYRHKSCENIVGEWYYFAKDY